MGIYKAKPYFQGGWEKYEIIYISELLDKVEKLKIYALKFSHYGT
jgi:hypothetical protein